AARPQALPGPPDGDRLAVLGQAPPARRHALRRGRDRAGPPGRARLPRPPGGGVLMNRFRNLLLVLLAVWASAAVLLIANSVLLNWLTPSPRDPGSAAVHSR